MQLVDTDMEAMIVDFATDVSRASLELPRLTTGQRKGVKKVIDQYPQLRCESYGFGAERRLHLFKAGPAWELCHGKGKEASEDPSAASKGICSVESLNVSVDSQAALPSPLPSPCANPRSCARSSPDSMQCSTAASSDECTQDESSSSPSSPELKSRDVHAWQVRNTFLHIEDPSVCQNARAVQSMPHGMFGQCLREESERVAASPVSSRVVGQNTPASAQVYYAGMLVKIEGLTKFPAFNGLMGVVQSFDATSGRYDLLLASCEFHKAKVKAENLRQALP